MLMENLSKRITSSLAERFLLSLCRSCVRLTFAAEDIPLDIVYEDEDIVVVNKPRGMVVHPAVGNWSGTLVNALMFHCGESLSGINGEHRPGIVHRIDKDTSGLLLSLPKTTALIIVLPHRLRHILRIAAMKRS